MPERLLDEFDVIDVLLRDLNNRVEKLESAVFALADTPGEPFEAARNARSILAEE